MANFLEKIIASTHERVKSLDENKLRGIAEQMPPFESEEIKTKYSLYSALKKRETAYICEVKKATPLKGLLVQDFKCNKIIEEYHLGGASAIAVQTEPYFFFGEDNFLTSTLEITDCPILRKDYIISPAQIYETKVMGVHAINLDVAVVGSKTAELVRIAESVGLEVMVEIHDEKELRTALKADAKIIGVNNRSIKTYRVNAELAAVIRPLVPKHIAYVAEGGIKSRAEVEVLESAEVDGILIGEVLVRGEDDVSEIRPMMNRLRGIREG